MMRKLWLIGLCATVIVLLPSFAQAQGGVQDGVKLGKVYVTGENPFIRLLDKADGTALTDVSYWRIIWSPVGAGRICYITTGDGTSPGDLRVALVDNRKVYDYLTEQIMVTIDKSIPERPFTVVQATFGDPGQGTFNDSGDVMTERKVTFQSAEYTGSLVWRDFEAPFQLDFPVGNDRIPFGITSLFFPAKAAEVIINGKKGAGKVYPQKLGPAQSSSAALAFSESWIK